MLNAAASFYPDTHAIVQRLQFLRSNSVAISSTEISRSIGAFRCKMEFILHREIIFAEILVAGANVSVKGSRALLLDEKLSTGNI